jgi:methionyl-tRNA formyltransferase
LVFSSIIQCPEVGELVKIIIMGTGPFAVPSCQRLVASGHEIALVVTRPPQGGTSKKQPETPVRSWAEAAGWPLFEPASINTPEAIERLRAVQADLLFVCDYGQILSRDCLAATRLGGINLHGSLLPRHRGAAPVQWTLLAGDDEAGVSVIHMTPGLDAGPVLAVDRVAISRDEHAGELEQRLAQLGADTTQRAVELLATWDGVAPIGTVQDRSAATKAPRLARGDGKLDFSHSAAVLERRVRGLQPWPGAFAELHWPSGKSLSLHLRAARGIPADELPAGTDAQPRTVGTAWPVDAATLGCDWPKPWDRLLAVQTGDGWLLVALVQPAGGRVMPAADFLRGHPIDHPAQFV